MENRVLIWKSLFIGQYAAVLSCLEMNGIDVALRNEHGTSVLSAEGTSGVELWIEKKNYQKAVELLHANGHISNVAYKEALGIQLSDVEDRQKDSSMRSHRKIIVTALVLFVVILGIFLWLEWVM